jgi:bacterioferritin
MASTHSSTVPRHKVETIKKDEYVQDASSSGITHSQLIELLNEDLSRAVLAISCYSQSKRVLYEVHTPALADTLKLHAEAQFNHAMTIVKQIDALGGEPILAPGVVPTCGPDDLAGLGVVNAAAAIFRYRCRIRQCEHLGEEQAAASVRIILIDEQEHLGRLVAAIGELDVATRNQAVARISHAVFCT